MLKSWCQILSLRNTGLLQTVKTQHGRKAEPLWATFSAQYVVRKLQSLDLPLPSFRTFVTATVPPDMCNEY